MDMCDLTSIIVTGLLIMNISHCQYLGNTGVFIAGELGTLIGADMVMLGGFKFLENGMSLGSVGVNSLWLGLCS